MLQNLHPTIKQNVYQIGSRSPSDYFGVIGIHTDILCFTSKAFSNVHVDDIVTLFLDANFKK